MAHLIQQLTEKHNAYLGIEGEEMRKSFKQGLAWAIDAARSSLSTESHQIRKAWQDGVMYSAKITELKKKKQQALRNFSRQREREKLGMPTRVQATFWEQVARDYQREINSLSL